MTLGQFVGGMLGLAGVTMSAIVMIRWFSTPELTEMQIFLENWPLCFGSAGLLTIACYMLRSFR